MKILAVDDEPLFCEVLVAELQNLGQSDVHVVYSAADALKQVISETKPFDCVLLDIDMPEMTGIDLCSLLRKTPQTSDVPIIMVTSRSELDSVDKAFAAGATDYLVKPLDSRELQGRMTMAVSITRERIARKQAAANSNQGTVFSFEEACRLDIEHSCLDYLAMQNYVLKLNSMQMFTQSAVGFRVENARELFQILTGADFKGVMADVAEIIIEAIRSETSIIAYAGSGRFVAVTGRYPDIDMETFADQIEQKLVTLNQWYAELGQLPVRLDVGQPVNRSLISLESPADVLEKAIENTYQPMFKVGGQPDTLRLGRGG